jgi:protein-disulfide isomerase
MPRLKQAGKASNNILSIVVVLIVLAAALGWIAMSGSPTQTSDDEAAMRESALASEHSPSVGDPGAKVHIVEFLDPACETCALFFPMVKQWMSEVPGKMRLTVRHVPFHKGSEYAVRILEASREQGKYWETLEALLMSQRQWTQNHTVLQDRILPAIANVGLDMDKLEADMNRMDILVRMERDQEDAKTVQVRATPEYYVNGRPLPSFGREQLAQLVREELAKAYPQ